MEEKYVENAEWSSMMASRGMIVSTMSLFSMVKFQSWSMVVHR